MDHGTSMTAVPREARLASGSDCSEPQAIPDQRNGPCKEDNRRQAPDEERSERMFNYIRDDKVADMPKALCKADGGIS